jgi:hypothetical protein
MNKLIKNSVLSAAVFFSVGSFAGEVNAPAPQAIPTAPDDKTNSTALHPAKPSSHTVIPKENPNPMPRSNVPAPQAIPTAPDNKTNSADIEPATPTSHTVIVPH